MSYTMHVYLGDDCGISPHAHIALGEIPGDACDATDAQIAENREAARDVYLKAFGEYPAACVVTVEDDVTVEEDES